MVSVDLDLYFTSPPGAVDLPLESLSPTRARPEGIRNAARLMDLAALGSHPRRAPLSVRPRPGGGWDVLDGNSTFAIARERGWPTIRCLVATAPPG